MRKFVLIITLIFSTILLSQDVTLNTFGFSGRNYNALPWTTSNEFDSSNSTNLQTLTIPFTFPAEAKIYGAYTQTGLANSLKVQKFDIPTANYKQEIYSIPKFNLFTFTDSSLASAESAKRIYGNSSLSPFVGYGGGVMYMYLKKNIGLNLDLSLRLAGNIANQTVAESMMSNLTFSYKIANNLFSYFKQSAKMNVFLQLSETTRFKLADLKSNDNSYLPDKSYYLKPGISLYSRSVTLEGLLKVPVNQSLETMTLNRLIKQEVSGSLGLKWSIPE